jgi:dUTP pyrophosphatase
MLVKIKKLQESAVIPSYSKIGDAGLDLTATSISYNNGLFLEYGTGLAIEIPEGFGGFIFPRSSISNYNLTLCNSVGVVDSNFRGEIKLRFKTPYNNQRYREYNIGDRIGQLVILPVPKIEFELTEELKETIRGSSGFGSSGV